MKKGLFCIVMLFCICVAMNAQGLKTYSGFYKAKNMNLFGTPKATYTYKNAEDGTRIYEGNFTYTCVTKPNIYDKVTGHFHDDCKEGLWIFTDKSPTESKVLKINYSEGYRSGTYEYTYISKGAIKESLKTTMKEGVMVGSVSGHLTSYNFHIYDYGVASSRGVIGKGTFNGQTDEKGLADGLWKLIMKNEKDNKTMLTFYDKWEHGVVKESYYIDDSTGDKIECATHETWGIPSVIFDLAHTPCSMENWIERGSDKPYQGILLHPSDIEEREGNKIYDCTIEKPIAESPSFPGGENALKQYLNSNNVEAEENGNDGIEEKCFDVVEEMPSFPGGVGALLAWLSNNMQYPKQARESGIQGRVIVEFIVEVDGSISNVKIGRSVDKDLDNEALRLVKGMPKWNPGKHNGTEVRVKYSIPILFRIS